MNNEPIPKRIKLTVAYDGTAYHGWQFQPNAKTIEGELKRTITTLLDEEITLVSASRTDTGVHALCNIAVFDTETLIPARKIAYALNQRLPDDIRIQSSEMVDGDFHPRRTESRKTYEYRIWNSDFPLPTKRLYYHFTYRPLDPAKMQKAADCLVGEHDFFSFCTDGIKRADKGTVRTIYSAEVTTHGEEVILTITGNGFLYNMVRIIAGTLIEVGTDRLSPEQIPEILAAKDRRLAGPTAPARGLTLINYEYLSSPLKD